MSDAKVQGILMAVISPDGRVICNVTDFAPDRPGGCTKKEGQTWRCRDRLAYKLIDSMSHPDIAKAASAYHAQGIMDEMKRKLGYRIETVEIGYEAE